LNGSIGSADATVTLNSVANLQSPGVGVIDRTDGAGNATPSLREYITYTGISGNQLTGVTRGVASSTAQAHNSGAQFEEVMSITHWNDMVSFMQNEHDATGKHVIATATINYTETKQLVATSLASLVVMHTSTWFDVSGASVNGLFPLHPTFVVTGPLSLATTGVGPALPMPQPAMFKFLSASLNIPPSTSSLVLNWKKNGTSIIASSNVLAILAGGTYVSTSSIATPFFVAGDIMTLDISNGGGGSLGLSVLGRAQ